MTDKIDATKLHTRLDMETGICTTPCLMIVCQTGDHDAPIRYHGFGGDGTATIYTDRDRAEKVLSTLNPAQRWVIQRVMMVSRVNVVEKNSDGAAEAP
jgi:hypothetical protein